MEKEKPPAWKTPVDYTKSRVVPKEAQPEWSPEEKEARRRAYQIYLRAGAQNSRPLEELIREQLELMRAVKEEQGLEKSH